MFENAETLAAAIRPISEAAYEIPQEHSPTMRVPARVIADGLLLEEIRRDHSLAQLVNVSTLPGVVQFVVGMPDMHEGYGFPVGGVAATRLPDGIISPGGIGFDINCGVRLLRTNVRADAVQPSIEAFVHELSRSVPTGYGRAGRLDLTDEQLDGVLSEGCEYLVRELGFGLERDLAHLEANGRLADADPARVSPRARERGRDQLGTLGGGNHFLEVQLLDQIFDAAAARAFGLFEGQLTVLIHTGSRGLGHQVCTDYLREMDEAMHRYGIAVPDRQLACVPFSSPEGRDYFAAMCAAANFAWCNRQVLTHRVREVLARVLPAVTAEIVYDVAHNIAKVERHGREQLCVHRKGATRAFGPARDGAVGQPVLIPGSMGTASFVLAGSDSSDEISFSSCCHGAGRRMSRAAAKHEVRGHLLRRELEARGIVVRCPSNAELAEEAPLAYKDVERVVEVVERAGIARRVARLRPIGVLKG